MQTPFTRMKKTTKEELYALSLASSQAKSGEVYIFELGSMDDFLGEDKAEIVRQRFISHKVNVKQITNKSLLPKFSDNNVFINTVMTFRYVPKDVFDIAKEILIFDDTVAIYNKDEMLVIKDADFAKSQKQLFVSIWKEGETPKLGFEYKPNHSFYKNLNYFLEGTQIIVWPDADAKTSYKGMSELELGGYVKNILIQDKDYYKDASYIIMIIWSLDGEKMVDVWKFNDNHVDDRSGPLSDVRVYREGVICDSLGLASGNTLIVLGYEEKIRRQSKDLQSYLDGPAPKLPLEMMNGLNFFD